MEEQLARYREKKAKEQSANKSWTSFIPSPVTSLFGTKPQGEQTLKNVKEDFTNISDREDDEPRLVISDSGQLNPRLVTVERVLKVILWFALWAVFLELQFGAVYFAVSLLFIIYRSTRTGPKKADRLSAYSVFNPNFERLEGTITAEQFEQELRFGATAVH